MLTNMNDACKVIRHKVPTITIEKNVNILQNLNYCMKFEHELQMKYHEASNTYLPEKTEEMRQEKIKDGPTS